MFVCTDSDCDLFAARGILDNFEILAAVLLPNTTTAHNVTYTNAMPAKLTKKLLCLVFPDDYVCG